MHKLVKLNCLEDFRGSFTKLIDGEYGYKQVFITESSAMVFRGFHFYGNQNESNRLVYVSEGCLVDILIDLRESSFSTTYELNLQQGDLVFLPKFCAHGFYTNTGCKLTYFFEKQHDPAFDFAINCFELIKNFDESKYLISKRDSEAIKISTITPLWA